MTVRPESLESGRDDPRFMDSPVVAGANPIRCPRCLSVKAQSLSPAARDWYCCGECGHIWPDEQKLQPGSQHAPELRKAR